MHDVEIIWNVWPFNVILWNSVREFLQGHGLNFLNNFLMWVFQWPIYLWNLTANSFFPYLYYIFYFLNWIPNVIFDTISDIIFFIPDTLFNIFNFVF